MVHTFNLRALLIFLLVGIMALSGAAFSLTRLDLIINRDLYNYGLQFSVEWAVQYWTYLRLIFAVIGFVVIVNSIGVGYLLLRARAGPSQRIEISKRPRSTGQKLSFVLLTIGAASLATSIWYASTILAFVGLGLTLWGGILTYVKSGEYVRRDLLETTTLPSLNAMGNLIEELELKGQALYLPPSYLRDVDSSRVYISSQKTNRLPMPSDVLEQENAFYIATSDGMIFKPPGVELTRLFEKIMKTSFAGISLENFERDFSKIAVERLELADKVEIEADGDGVAITLVKTPYAKICYKARELHNISGLVGCPLCSALACALAKTTGKLLLIEKEEADEKSNTIKAAYRFLNLPER